MTAPSGKTAIVTGASSGIGRASAEALAQAGYHRVRHKPQIERSQHRRRDHACLRRDR